MAIKHSRLWETFRQPSSSSLIELLEGNRTKPNNWGDYHSYHSLDCLTIGSITPRSPDNIVRNETRIPGADTVPIWLVPMIREVQHKNPESDSFQMHHPSPSATGNSRPYVHVYFACLVRAQVSLPAPWGSYQWVQWVRRFGGTFYGPVACNLMQSNPHKGLFLPALSTDPFFPPFLHRCTK